MRIIKRRACSCGELAGRLVRRGFDAGLAAELARDLQQAGLLDDAAYAESVAHAASAGQPVSEAFLVRKLTARLIEPDLARAAARRALSGRDPVEDAARFAARKLGASTLPAETARRRIAGALARRGLDVDTITAALQRVAPGPQDDG